MPGDSPRLVSYGRLFCTALVFAFVWGVVHFALLSQRLDAKFFAWLEAIPAEVDVDLSHAGTYETPLHQTFSASHGQPVVLEIQDQDSLPENAFDGLIGKVEVIDEAQQVVVEKPLARRVRPWYNVQMLPGLELADFDNFPTGQYTLRLTIAQPATALAGQAQRMSVRYDICSCERVPAVLSKYLAIALSVPAAIIALCVLPGWARHGIWMTTERAHRILHEEAKATDSVQEPPRGE